VLTPYQGLMTYFKVCYHSILWISHDGMKSHRINGVYTEDISKYLILSMKS
jgi:hypothetical protein